MSTHPTLGISGAKPRLPKPDGNGAPSKEALASLSHEYLTIRNRGQAAKAAVAEMELARRKGTLIDKKAALDSGRYIATVFRQRALLAHREIARQLVTQNLVDAEDEHAASMLIDGEIRKLLVEIAHLPERTLDPAWMAELERKELGLTDSERRQTPKEHAAEQARATRRREKKTKVMQELRSRAQ